MKKPETIKLKNPDYRIITAENPSCFSAEAFRRIKVCVDTLSIENPIKVIQICSALPGDGKTTTLLNMAVAYAESGKKVLLIDMDMRKPRMHRAFHAENTNGLSEYLSGNITVLDNIIKSTSYKNIDFICAGPSPVRPSSLLSLEKLTETIGQLKEMYDVILIDEPPILVSSDCCVVSRFCDGAIFQISRKNTDKIAAVSAVKILRQNGVNILGCVFSEIESERDSYTYRYQYQYRYK